MPTRTLPAETTIPEATRPEPLPFLAGQPSVNQSEQVLLSYDDCPTSAAAFRATLAEASDLGVGLLLFPDGRCVANLRAGGFDLVAYARERGHWVGNHSHTHPRLTELTDEQVRAEITGEPLSNLLRPPFGAVDERTLAVIESVGQRVVMWTLDTNDWRGGTGAEIADRVIAHADPGDVVLLHLQHPGFTPEALRQIATGLRARGLELCAPASAPTTALAPESIC